MEANNTSKITATITGENGQPLNLELRHDRDGAYRWYQDGQDTEVSGDNIADAIAQAKAAWRTWGIQVHLLTQNTRHGLATLGRAWGEQEVEAWKDQHDGTMDAAPAWTMGTYCGDIDSHAGLDKADAESDDEAVRDAYFAARDEAERTIDTAARQVWESAR